MKKFLTFFCGRKMIGEGTVEKFTKEKGSSARLQNADVVMVDEFNKGEWRTTTHKLKR